MASVVPWTGSETHMFFCTVAIRGGRNEGGTHSTGSEKNAVAKSYATLLFLVNEKCNVITQVWQNLALSDCLRAPSSHFRVETSGSQGRRKVSALTALGLRTPRVSRVSLAFPPVPCGIPVRTQDLAPKMLEIVGIKPFRKGCAWA